MKAWYNLKKKPWEYVFAYFVTKWYGFCFIWHSEHCEEEKTLSRHRIGDNFLLCLNNGNQEVYMHAYMYILFILFLPYYFILTFKGHQKSVVMFHFLLLNKTTNCWERMHKNIAGLVLVAGNKVINGILQILSVSKDAFFMKLSFILWKIQPPSRVCIKHLQCLCRFLLYCCIWERCKWQVNWDL